MQTLLVTGGQGALAKALIAKFSESWVVNAPGRDEMDVLEEDQVNGFFKQLESIDMLICNAGVTRDSILMKMTEKDWDRCLDANLRGAFLCAKAAARKMLQQRKGHILFIGSFSAFEPPIGQANYAAAKAGLLGLKSSLAKELGPRGVRVNLVVPGWMETKMTEGVSEKQRQAVLDQHCLGEFNQVEAVADFIFTLQEKLLFTSGQTFHLDSRILS